MNVGPLGMIGSAAGSPLSQIKGSDADKSTQAATDQSRRTDSADNAEKAAGIGQTEQDEQASDRDADGRRLWERSDASTDRASQERDAPDGDAPGQAPQSKDASGQSGSQLDLSV